MKETFHKTNTHENILGTLEVLYGEEVEGRRDLKQALQQIQENKDVCYASELVQDDPDLVRQLVQTKAATLASQEAFYNRHIADRHGIEARALFSQIAHARSQQLHLALEKRRGALSSGLLVYTDYTPVQTKRPLANIIAHQVYFQYYRSGDSLMPLNITDDLLKNIRAQIGEQRSNPLLELLILAYLGYGQAGRGKILGYVLEDGRGTYGRQKVWGDEFAQSHRKKARGGRKKKGNRRIRPAKKIIDLIFDSQEGISLPNTLILGDDKDYTIPYSQSRYNHVVQIAKEMGFDISGLGPFSSVTIQENRAIAVFKSPWYVMNIRGLYPTDQLQRMALMYPELLTTDPLTIYNREKPGSLILKP